MKKRKQRMEARQGDAERTFLDCDTRTPGGRNYQYDVAASELSLCTEQTAAALRIDKAMELQPMCRLSKSVGTSDKWDEA